MQVEVSRHAEDRLKERLGIPKRSVRRHAQKAWDEGVMPGDYYCRSVGAEWERRQMVDQSVLYMFYGDLLHVWGFKNEVPSLVTVYDPLSPPPSHTEAYVAGTAMRLAWGGYRHIRSLKSARK